MTIAAMKQALEFAESKCSGSCDAEYRPCWALVVANDLRAAIAEQEKCEPVAYLEMIDGYVIGFESPTKGIPVFTHHAPVPAGMVLVPVEPTPEMIDNVITERYDAMLTGKEHTFIDIYKAMLAAAPKEKP